MFKVDNGERKEELLEKFREASGSDVLYQCLRNKLEHGCTYSREIEEKIEGIRKTLKLKHAIPDWLHLID
jgi:hypothetical protein